MMAHTMTALSATDTAILSGMKIMALDHDHETPHQDYAYSDDDAASDSTVTAVAKDPSPHATEKPGIDWMDEIEHSFGNSYSLDDFNAYLEPIRPHIIQQPATRTRQKSKFSAMKQKMKRAFCISATAKQQQQQQQQQQKHQSLMQSALPVFLTASDAHWNPSTTTTTTDTSSILRPPDQISAHSNKSNSGGSFSFTTTTTTTTAATKSQRKRRSTVSRIFSRTPAFGTSVGPLPIKGILKTTTKSGILLGTFSQLPPERWSNARLSVYSSSNNNRNCYTVLSLNNNNNNNNKPKSQPLDLEQQLHVKKGRLLRFNETVDIQETYAKEDYDRSSDTDAVCTRLTPTKATLIKQELNNFKLYEMVVADESRDFTHFFL